MGAGTSASTGGVCARPIATLDAVASVEGGRAWAAATLDAVASMEGGRAWAARSKLLGGGWVLGSDALVDSGADRWCAPAGQTGDLEPSS
jgi:hypothetical protein